VHAQPAAYFRLIGSLRHSIILLFRLVPRPGGKKEPATRSRPFFCMTRRCFLIDGALTKRANYTSGFSMRSTIPLTPNRDDTHPRISSENGRKSLLPVFHGSESFRIVWRSKSGPE
jgi:hypothetical protein